jgi:hypothetical protein
MSWSVLIRRLVLLFGLLVSMLVGFTAACTPARHLLATADPTPMGPPPHPDLFTALPGDTGERLARWEAGRPALLAQLDATLYGASPADAAVASAGPAADFGAEGARGVRTLQALELTLPDEARVRLDLALITPEVGAPVRGIFLIPNECGLRAALRDETLPEPQGYTPGYCNAEGLLADLIGPMFGPWVAGPPVDWLLDRGYAIAAWHESDVAPDSARLHAESLKRLGLDPRADGRPGTISLWAWTLSRVADALRADPRFAETPLLTMGHSRRGKAVLLAAARDERFAVTIAHQAGTGGASLHGDGVGEPISAITRSYPHWFAAQYARYGGNESDLPIDQHALIALAAPRAVLLGNAWRDTWSDPAGAWRAAQAASPAWDIYGAPGLAQARLASMDTSGRLAVHIRTGTHGVTDADWRAFLDFADAHTPPLD